MKGPIIIVDDDEDDHYLIKRICEKIGVKVPVIFFSAATNAFDFLQNTKEIPFIILSDVNMPLMSGMELRQKIAEDPILGTKSIPFLFFSSAAMGGVVREAYSHCIQGFFVKEQSLEKMERTLRTIFDYWEKAENPNMS